MHARTDARRHGTVRLGGHRGPWFAGLLVLLLAWAAAPAAASPEWRIDGAANTAAAPGDTFSYHIEIKNVGDADADGSTEPLTLNGTLPVGLTIAGASDPGIWDCSSMVPGSQTFTCQSTALVPALTPATPGVSWTTLTIEATVDSGGSGVLTSTFEVSGGDPADGDPTTPSASTAVPVAISTEPLAFGIAAFDAQTTDAAGAPLTQAAGHPFEATTWLDFNTSTDPGILRGDVWPVEQVKDVDVDLPPGFVGDLSGIDRCTLPQLANSEKFVPRPLCPSTSQVGTTFVKTPSFGGHVLLGPVPVFNLEPPSDAPARFGFNVAGVVVTLDVSVRSESDYGLTAHLRNIPEGLAGAGAIVTLWGVPADPIHTPERVCAGDRSPWEGGPTCASGAPLTPLLRNPTSCTPMNVGLPTTVRADSWVHPGIFRETTIFSHDPVGYPFPPSSWGLQQGTADCDRVPFRPALDVTPGTTQSGEPSGYSFDLSLPQPNDPLNPGESDLRRAVITLPLGATFSATVAQGLTGCSPAQIKLHTEEDAACPASSKIGTVSVTTPALPDPLEGAVYLAAPHDNPFDTLIALYIVARGSGVTVKLPARVDLDPLTGQATTTIDDSPQAPFSNVHLEFKDGSRAPFVNPRACGTYTVRAQLTSWSERVVDIDSSYDISRDGRGAPCGPPKFTPTFRAGTESNSAGTSSNFHVRLTREDDDEELAGLRLDMPGGILGYVSRVNLCGEADAQHGTCPESSRIGTVTVGAGAGPDPFYITNGRLYMTGPYKGAPFGFEVVVPAVAGPFNLGDVVVRQALYVDKHDATLRVISDPLPIRVQGVTLGVRDIRVAIDKPGFFLNPTGCDVKTIAGVIESAIGQEVPVSDRYQASECQSLKLAPKMRLIVGARGRTYRNASTPFTTILTQTRGQVNLRYVKVSLPTTLNARLNVVNRACRREEFESGHCEQARAGTAIARTPVLRDPLVGGVYFVKNGRPLPDIFVALRGQADFDLIGRVSIPGGKHLATTFASVPDVPITSFELRLVAGSHGPVGAATNLCSRHGRNGRAAIDYIGQNGKTLQVNPKVTIRGCPRPARRHRGHTGRHRR